MKRKYKTKFPVSRIKKIMRVDEEVGKLAQATPVLVSKVLELFLQSLIDETCKETAAQGAAKMTPEHLRACVKNTEKFDFLDSVVNKGALPADVEDET
ncbi:histone-fold-containing protein [Hyaloraphidium curvatum]|nr:histone-fold-containing protein [Hyaloraphidium curvatum]